METRKFFMKFIISIFVLVIILGIYYYKIHCLRTSVNVADLTDVNILNLESEKYIELPARTKNGYAMTITGISYNKRDDCFYIGNYGKALKDDKEIHPSIEEMDSEFLEISDEIFFLDDNLDIQGIAYDEINDSIWYTNGKNIVNYSIDKKETINNFALGKYAKYKANGICIDNRDGSLWVLCMYKYLLNYKKDGSLIESYNCDYIGQDHICMDENGKIYISVGIDYQGNDNFVVSFDKNFNIDTVYRVHESYAIEGIIVIDSKLYVVNDGIYHEAKINKNYIQEYSLHKKKGEVQ